MNKYSNKHNQTVPLQCTAQTIAQMLMSARRSVGISAGAPSPVHCTLQRVCSLRLIQQASHSGITSWDHHNKSKWIVHQQCVSYEKHELCK